jgi:hypothetical protein
MTSMRREGAGRASSESAADVREALAYWLLGSTHPLGGRPDLKKSWRSDTDEVLVRRSPDWTSRRCPPEPLLAAAQRLLEELTRGGASP